jgi:hypothetical protein
MRAKRVPALGPKTGQNHSPTKDRSGRRREPIFVTVRGGLVKDRTLIAQDILGCDRDAEKSDARTPTL